MLVVVVTIFALLWLPHRGVLVYNTVAALTKSPAYMDLWFLMFAKTCIYINRLVSRISHFTQKRSILNHKPFLRAIIVNFLIR